MITDLLSSTVVDSLTSGVLAVDLEGRVLFVNTALAKRLGIDREASVGKSALGLFGTLNPRTSVKRSPMYAFRRRDDTKNTFREVEWSDGKRIVHLREDSSPLHDESGQLVGRLFAYHDLSWEKTIDQMKSEFISIASHELRTPMTSIKGSVDLILGGCVGEVSPEALELLEIAHGACDRMIRLINNILDLSKIEAGQIKLNLTSVDLEAVAERAARALGPLAGPDEIALKVEKLSEIPHIEADEDRVEQIITNLISNAIKFSPAKGQVTIQISTEGNWLRCAVIDQGCGIEEKDLDRIFGKFQQLSAPKRGAGTGLGLAITHALVAEHRGKIWVESKAGEGSRFIFALPINLRRATPTS